MSLRTYDFVIYGIKLVWEDFNLEKLKEVIPGIKDDNDSLWEDFQLIKGYVKDHFPGINLKGSCPNLGIGVEEFVFCIYFKGMPEKLTKKAIDEWIDNLPMKSYKDVMEFLGLEYTEPRFEAIHNMTII